jgi:predicted ABC-type ATPase
MAETPNVYIVAGPNGAGKSTFARLFLPEYADCREFVNADLIAAGLSPFNPEGAAIQAGRLILERVETLARAGVDFGFEATLAGRGYATLLRKLKESGYRLHVFFLWLPSVEMALARVRDRVLAGGHSVPEEVVRCRFTRGLANLFQLYAPLLDSGQILDNAEDQPRGGQLEGLSLSTIFEKAERAMKEAVAAAIAEHWRAGRPVHVWRDGRVVALYPDGAQIPLEETQSKP